jgi:hypothetical protein
MEKFLFTIKSSRRDDGTKNPKLYLKSLPNLLIPINGVLQQQYSLSVLSFLGTIGGFTLKTKLHSKYKKYMN